MKTIHYQETPVGWIGIAEEDGEITDLLFGKDNVKEGMAKGKTPLTELAGQQVQEYFEGKRESFELPIRLDGTEFQKKVWNALCGIPYGETRSYKEIAKAIGNEKAVRAVGMANNRNPISIIVPCHRVIGSDGKLVGYGGGLDAKEHLLGLEKAATKRR